MITLIKVTTLFLAAVSACTTWSGFRSIGQLSSDEFTREVMPVLMAGASFLASIALWFSLFTWYPKADKDTKRKLNWAMGITGIIIFGLSTIWTVMGLGGDAALIHHMNHTVKKTEEILNSIAGRVEKETQMATSSKMLSEQFTGLASMEKGGAFTVDKDRKIIYEGRGEVFIQLTSLSQTLTNLEQLITSSVTSRRNTIEEVKEEISKLRETVADTNTPPSTRMRYFSAKLSTVNQLFQKIQSQQVDRLAKEVSRQLQSLSATNAPKGGTKVGEAQKSAVDRLSQTVDSAQKIMLKFTESGSNEFFEISPLTAIDMGNAVIRYAYVILPAWAGAIALDYVPVLFLFILNWTAKIREEEEIKKMQREIQKETEE